PQIFNSGGFGPPRSFTNASTWPWVAHLASGLQPATLRPIQTRFPYGFASRLNLATNHNSLAHYAKGTRSPQPKLKLPPFVGTRFQGLFHSPRRGAFHLSLTVLVHYRSAGST